MNLEPVANVYTVEAAQEYQRIPQFAAQQTSGQGSVPIGVAKLPEKMSMRDLQLELLEDDDEKQKTAPTEPAAAPESAPAAAPESAPAAQSSPRGRARRQAPRAPPRRHSTAPRRPSRTHPSSARST